MVEAGENTPHLRTTLLGIIWNIRRKECLRWHDDESSVLTPKTKMRTRFGVSYSNLNAKVTLLSPYDRIVKSNIADASSGHSTKPC